MDIPVKIGVSKCRHLYAYYHRYNGGWPFKIHHFLWFWIKLDSSYYSPTEDSIKLTPKRIYKMFDYIPHIMLGAFALSLVLLHTVYVN